MAIPDPLIEVDRAISDLRRGALVKLVDGSNSILMLAAELLTADQLEVLNRQTTPPQLILTGTRANALGIDQAVRPASMVSHPNSLSLEIIEFLSNPTTVLVHQPNLTGLVVHDASRLAQASITLSKLARLLPATLITQAEETPDTLTVRVSSIESYIPQTAYALKLVSRARVPLENIENAQVVAFRPNNGGTEHLAIVVADIDPTKPVLVRLHSECFTGDLIGSLRCDCGNQLRGAIDEMVRGGSGILLYLAQEGRGIGLANKLRAYQLQDAGLDTVDANLQLGFDSDERNYLPAAQMLKMLGVSRVRLMTNNPAKVAALTKYGIEVVERVPHAFPSNRHNDSYLRVKASKSGHLFEF